MRTTLKKVLSTAVALIMLFSLSSCSLNQYDEEKVGKDMEEILTQLLETVQEGNKELFKTFFAYHVVELPDFEEGLNYVFEKYQGYLLDVKLRSAGHTGDEIRPGEHRYYAYMTFIATTSEKEYMICVEFYTKYESENPEEPYKIRKFSLLAKQEDGNFEDDGMGFNLRYGIYYPGWIDEDSI